MSVQDVDQRETVGRARAHWPADSSEPVLETTVGGVLRAAAASDPDGLAMVGGLPDPAARRRWTFAELLADAERAAHTLASRFRRGERVAAWAPNLPEWIILEYGAALAGLTLVTVNPAYRPSALKVCRHCGGRGARARRGAHRIEPRQPMSCRAHAENRQPRSSSGAD